MPEAEPGLRDPGQTEADINDLPPANPRCLFVDDFCSPECELYPDALAVSNGQGDGETVEEYRTKMLNASIGAYALKARKCTLKKNQLGVE